MTFDELEMIYNRLAEAIDRAGPGNESVMLAKLVLLLAADRTDLDRVLARIEEAERDLRDGWLPKD